MRHRLALQRRPGEAEIQLLQEVLCALPGMQSVQLEGGRLVLVYRLPDASLACIEAMLDGIGLNLSRRWRDRLFRAVIRYSEDCRRPALEAARRPPKACCNRPPK